MKRMSNNLTLFLVTMVFFAACSEDDALNPAAQRPAYNNLALSQLSEIETPYQYIFNPDKSARNGRYADDDILTGIREKVNEIFPQATVIDEIESDRERGIAVWEVELEMPSDAEVEFKISKDLQEVVKISGDDDEIDYEVNPGGSFISLSEAVRAARNAVRGEAEEWELELNDDDIWVYEIEIESDRNDDDDVDVLIHAYTGDLIAIYHDDDDRYERDDDDDDDDDNDDDDD